MASKEAWKEKCEGLEEQVRILQQQNQELSKRVADYELRSAEVDPTPEPTLPDPAADPYPTLDFQDELEGELP